MNKEEQAKVEAEKEQQRAAMREERRKQGEAMVRFVDGLVMDVCSHSPGSAATALKAAYDNQFRPNLLDRLVKGA